jgi:tRNA pseudouridine55 synthase
VNPPAIFSRVVLVDKPAGPTSFDIVRKARKGLREKVGHAGTLDPFATGLLVVLIGQATRISNLLMELPKEYEFVVQFGAVSSTADPTGEITPTRGRVTQEAVAEALQGFKGTITQRVPMTSAVKVNGEALYRKAHRGEIMETPERQVMVYDLSMLAFDEDGQTATLRATTGGGTYIRSLAEDLGVCTGAGAYAASLRRVRSGGFSVAGALQMAELSPERYREGGRGIYDLDEALSFLPVHELADREAHLAANGGSLQDAPSGRFRVHGPDGLLGVYEDRLGEARPLVVFARTE